MFLLNKYHISENTKKNKTKYFSNIKIPQTKPSKKLYCLQYSTPNSTPNSITNSITNIIQYIIHYV